MDNLKKTNISKLSIISFDAVPSSDRGGQEKSLFDILSHLCQFYNVSIAYQKEGDFLSTYQEKGIQTIQIKATHLTHKKKISSYRNLVQSYKKLKSHQFDIAYTNELIDIPLAAYLKRKNKVKKLVCHLRLPPPNQDILKKQNQISKSIHHVDAFFVGTKKMKQLYGDFGIQPELIHVVPNAFEFNQKVIQKTPKSNKTLGFIGRMAPEKGLEELIDVVFELNKSLKYYLVVGGKPVNQIQEKYFLKLKEKVKQLELNDQVSFLGQVNDLNDFYSKVDLCVFNSNWEEPFGRVLVESIIYHTPIIGKEVGSVKEIISGSDFNNTYSDATELVDCIDSFFKNPTAYPINKIKESMKSKYEIKSIIELIKSHFEEIIDV